MKLGQYPGFPFSTFSNQTKLSSPDQNDPHKVPNHTMSINQSINQSWVYIAHKHKASNALVR